MRPSLPSLALLFLLLPSGGSMVSAQTPPENPVAPPASPVSPVPPPSKLEQLESTYLFSLRKFHGPVLLDYQRELERLKQQLIARSRPEDARMVDAEIEYVKTLSVTTGVLPYTALIPPPPAPAPADQPPGPPGGPPRRNKMPNAALSLSAAEASKTKLPMNASAEGLPLGAIEWQVGKLPAGSYDIVMLYACAAMEKPERLSLSFAGRDFNVAPLPVERVTASDSTYRPYRLTKVVIDQDVADATLSLQSEAAPPHLFVRGVFFIKRD